MWPKRCSRFPSEKKLAPNSKFASCKRPFLIYSERYLQTVWGIEAVVLQARWRTSSPSSGSRRICCAIRWRGTPTRSWHWRQEAMADVSPTLRWTVCRGKRLFLWHSWHPWLENTSPYAQTTDNGLHTRTPHLPEFGKELYPWGQEPTVGERHYLYSHPSKSKQHGRLFFLLPFATPRRLYERDYRL